jgi:hypothetical protein
MKLKTFLITLFFLIFQDSYQPKTGSKSTRQKMPARLTPKKWNTFFKT